MANVPDRQARRVTGRVPVMRETRYDLTSSSVIAAGFVLIGIVVLLVAIWLSNLLPERTVAAVTMVVGAGMSEDGDINELLLVESPEDPTDDPSLSNDQEETQLKEVLEKTVSASGEAAQFQLVNNFSGSESSGTLGSSAGTSGNPFGVGGSGRGGVKREQRWTVEFIDGRSLSRYAQQLDFFGIELGVVFPDGRVVYVNKLSSGFAVREDRIDSGDQRLFMNWQEGNRVKADLKLLADAGVADAGAGRVLHFYSAEAEMLLAKVEMDYAERPADQIRRTRFRATGEPGAFHFVVESQKYR